MASRGRLPVVMVATKNGGTAALSRRGGPIGCSLVTCGHVAGHA